MLGPSGSGKTTTLRLIAGFELPDGGRVELGGADVARRPPFERDVNTVFQDYALFPHMTRARQRRLRPARSSKVGAAERRTRAQEALEMVRLPDVGGRKPAQLSGGQRQRVALARAIVNRPRVLLLDEPLGALDLKLREEMQGELKRIQREVGITFVYVTHDQDEALSMSDRLAVFNEGRIEQVGTPAEVYERPRTSSSPASSASRTCSSATGAAFTIRPEKIRILGADDGAPTASRRGRAPCVDASYVGQAPATRSSSTGAAALIVTRAEPRDITRRGPRHARAAGASRMARAADVAIDRMQPPPEEDA